MTNAELTSPSAYAPNSLRKGYIKWMTDLPRLLVQDGAIKRPRNASPKTPFCRHSQIFMATRDCVIVTQRRLMVTAQLCVQSHTNKRYVPRHPLRNTTICNYNQEHHASGLMGKTLLNTQHLCFMDRAIQLANPTSRVRVGWQYSFTRWKSIYKHLVIYLPIGYGHAFASKLNLCNIFWPSPVLTSQLSWLRVCRASVNTRQPFDLTRFVINFPTGGHMANDASSRFSPMVEITWPPTTAMFIHMKPETFNFARNYLSTVSVWSRSCWLFGRGVVKVTL